MRHGEKHEADRRFGARWRAAHWLSRPRRPAGGEQPDGLRVP